MQEILEILHYGILQILLRTHHLFVMQFRLTIRLVLPVLQVNNLIRLDQNNLKPLRYLLVPPSEQDINSFEVESRPILDFAKKHDLLVSGGWGVGADLIAWVFVGKRMNSV